MCVFVCFDVHTTALNHGFQVVCMFDFFFILICCTAPVLTYINANEGEYKRERERRRNRIHRPSQGLFLFICICVFPSLYYLA